MSFRFLLGPYPGVPPHRPRVSRTPRVPRAPISPAPSDRGGRPGRRPSASGATPVAPRHARRAARSRVGWCARPGRRGASRGPAGAGGPARCRRAGRRPRSARRGERCEASGTVAVLGLLVVGEHAPQLGAEGGVGGAQLRQQGGAAVGGRRLRPVKQLAQPLVALGGHLRRPPAAGRDGPRAGQATNGPRGREKSQGFCAPFPPLPVGRPDVPERPESRNRSLSPFTERSV